MPNANSENKGKPFHLSPDPLLRVLPRLRASYNPPPPGRGMSRREQDSRASEMMITGGEGRAVPLSHCVRSLFHIHCVGIFTRRFCQLNFPYETKDMGMKIIGRATADKNRTIDKTTSETRNGTQKRNARQNARRNAKPQRRARRHDETEERNDKKRNEKRNEERNEGQNEKRDGRNRHDMR